MLIGCSCCCRGDKRSGREEVCHLGFVPFLEPKYLVWLCGEGRDVDLSIVCTLLVFTLLFFSF